MNRYVKFDEDQIRKEIRQKPPGIYELRIIMTDFFNTKLSCYFPSESPDSMIDQIKKWNYPSNCCVNFYLTINPVKEYCRAREQYNSLRKTRVMTQQDDVDRITWFVVDVDPDHPAGVSASDREKEAARQQAIEVCQYMENIGFKNPEIVDSGNGFHLKYRIDLSNTAEKRERLRLMTDALHRRFPMVDRSLKDVSRVLKLPGTIAMKGRNVDERPYRMARIIREATMVNELEGVNDDE